MPQIPELIKKPPVPPKLDSGPIRRAYPAAKTSLDVLHERYPKSMDFLGGFSGLGKGMGDAFPTYWNPRPTGSKSGALGDVVGQLNPLHMLPIAGMTRFLKAAKFTAREEGAVAKLVKAGLSDKEALTKLGLGTRRVPDVPARVESTAWEEKELERTLEKIKARPEEIEKIRMINEDYPRVAAHNTNIGAHPHDTFSFDLGSIYPVEEDARKSGMILYPHDAWYHGILAKTFAEEQHHTGQALQKPGFWEDYADQTKKFGYEGNLYERRAKVGAKERVLDVENRLARQKSVDLNAKDYGLNAPKISRDIELNDAYNNFLETHKTAMTAAKKPQITVKKK